MKTKSFRKYLEKRLDKAEIKELEKQADLEAKALIALQNQVSEAVEQYAEKESIGFNELVRRMGVSPTQASKIQKGEANLTLATLAHIAAMLGKKPLISFKRH